MASSASPRTSTASERHNRQATPTLPSKFRVPPLPPRIHRRLHLSALRDGLVISVSRLNGNQKPNGEDLWLEYGHKGQIKRWQDVDAQCKQTFDFQNNDLEEPLSIEIGGILGLSRLWETSYLFILSNPVSKSSKGASNTGGSIGTGRKSTGTVRLFPRDVKNEFPDVPMHAPGPVDESDQLMRGLRFIAEREGLLSPNGRPLYQSPNAGGEDRNDVDSEHEHDSETDGQGTAYEVRDVYAVPLTRKGAEAVIRVIQSNKAKVKPSTHQTRNESPSGARSPRPGDQEKGAESSAQAFARALNPARWNLNLSKKGPPGSASGGRSDEHNSTAQVKDSSKLSEPFTFVERPKSSGRQTPETSGDLGESMYNSVHSASSEVDVNTALQRLKDTDLSRSQDSVISTDLEGSNTLKSPRMVKRGSFLDGLKVDWSKMNLFSKDQNQAAHKEQDEIEAQVPGVLDDTKAAGETVTLNDGQVEDAEKSVPEPSTATPGQRRDLETKIIREMVNVLGGGGFFYSFETDLSHNLQQKMKQVNNRKQSGGLLASLLEKEKGSKSSLNLADSGSPSAQVDLSESLLSSASAPGLAPAADIKENKGAETHAEKQEPGGTWIEPDVGLPLWRRVDQRFMWNAWMVREFIDAGLHEFILPIIQGWVQASRFFIPPSEPAGITTLSDSKSPPAPKSKAEKDLGPPSTPVDLVLISRRSRDRAGLRFQRRGIDEEGNVANFVETEMIIRVKVEGKWSIFSFVQVRGSIPLFWSQASTLIDMKPAPKLDRPVDQTRATTRLHFEELKRRYGPQTIVNLSEATGKEASVTIGYRDVVKDLDDPDVRYNEFDFHRECKGMKYENISKLISQLSSTFSEQGYFWMCQGEVMREQNGVFRVNCIDCLDRTNVVESALGRHVLATQLTQVGMTPDTLTSDIEFVYNDAWANNGDQISRLYAGTSALKGDFTRTGKRDLSGMINDGLNSVARMRRGAIEDFYLQAVISYMVGERNLTVFSEVLSNLASNDRTNLIRLSRIRATAIETCTARVIEEGEHRVNGWTVFSPEEPNTRFTRKLEEKILILTHQALYVVSFDYNLEKVITSTRIPLLNVVSMYKGAYILSALEESGRDPAENAGFVVTYRSAKASTRISSYSVDNTAALGTSPTSSPQATATAATAGNDDEPDDFFAFKILPREFITFTHSGHHDDEDVDENQQQQQRGRDETCKDVADRMVKRIQEECVKATGHVGGYIGGHSRSDGFVRDEDVVGLVEAQKATSLVARADYALKRFLWMP